MTNLPFTKRSGIVISWDSKGRYAAAIRRHGAPVRNAEDLETFLGLIDQHYGCVAVAEVFPETVREPRPNCLAEIHRCAIRNPDSLFIAAGDRKLSLLTTKLRILGFAEVMTTMLDLRRIPSMAEKHWNFIRWPQQNLESQVVDNLPW